MNPNSNPSLGPGSALLGGAAPAMNAMQGGGGVQGMNSQVTPASAIYSPGVESTVNTVLPNTSAMNHFAFQGAMGTGAATNPTSPQQLPPQQPNAPQPPKAETASIIEALTKRLHDLTKLEHAIHGVQ